MANRRRDSDPDSHCSATAAASLSEPSKQPLNDNQHAMSDHAITADKESNEGETTYFLLDIATDNEDSKDNESMSSKTSSNSTSSSVSAQVVIDHGNSLPRRLTKSGTRHLLRSGDDESESDYAYSVTAGRGDPRSSSDQNQLGMSIGKEYAPDQNNSTTADNHDFDFRRSSDTDPGDEQEQRGWKSSDGAKEQDENLANLGPMAIYTDEHDDLLEEMPAWGQEHARPNSDRTDSQRYGERENIGEPYTQPRQHGKSNKRLQRVLQADLHSQSWSRRESLKSNRDPGLSSEEALRKLLHTANQIVDEERARVDKRLNTREWLLRRETLLGIFCAITLLVFYIAGYQKSDPYQFRLTGALVEAILILVMIAWNGYLYRREQLLTCREMADRATTIIDALERSGMNMVQDTKIPFIPSMSVAKVVRDGVVRTFPVNLLVDGDVVEMLYGDIAPGRMKYLHKPTTAESTGLHDDRNVMDDELAHPETENPGLPQAREYYLAKDQTFKPSFFGVPPPSGLMEEYLRARGRHQFALLETPLEKNMRSAFLQQRPITVFANETLVIVQLFYHYIIWIVLAIAFIANILRFALRDFAIDKFPVDQIVEEVFTLPTLCVLPLLPLCLPSLWLIARSFGNAQLLILFEALQISKTEYEDDDEVDEFDAEAPPPTKDLELSPNAVWDRFCALLTKWDRLSLTRSTNLLESLGSTTVICCLDKEGTIANPFPTAEQLMFPNSEEDISCLDLEEDEDEPYGYKFEDQDWEHSLPCLKPVGLNFMLNTNCGVIQGRKRSDYHRRRSKLHVYGKTSPARQTCLCRLGKCIGFQDEALQSFALRAEIYVFAPYHDILNIPRYEYSQYFSFEVPNALSTVFEEKTSGSYQLLTDGHPALVMDKCSDYWDGSSLQTMSGQMEKKINDFFQNALVHDMQCIAYAYRPINTVNNSRISFLNPQDNEEEPGCAFVVLPYKLPSSASSSSSESSSSDESVEPPSSTNKFAVRQGLQEECSMESERTMIKSNKKEGTSKRRRQRSNRTLESPSNSESEGNNSATDYSFEEDEPLDEQEEESFYKEVVKGQIFLGMTALCHQPKQNVVDFIEDLGLAGIRFVYFSPTAERESKAFAERLGLETDWNSCILLSSTDDDNCGNGYLQTHDIKAQLPRGIDQIRPHLENVDDIPLHVSLFAECTPRAMREMIRVFQEYGEVVCCIGNALNVKNTESFALADISIAMEPMHTRAQTKGRLSLSGRQPPLAVGASLVSLPCGLFMQYETSLYAVTQLIRDARRLLNCVRMGFAFYAAACMSMTLIQLLTSCILLPPALTGYQILWIMWIILPVLTISMLFTPHEDNTMLLMPGKNTEHLADLRRFMLYYVLRFILPILMSLAVYVLTLMSVLNLSATRVFGGFGSSGWLHWTEEEQWAVLYAQNFMLIAFVWYIAWISLSFLHRTSSLRKFIPFRNKIWTLAFFVSIALQFCFCAVSLARGPFPLIKVWWFVYLLIFAWPIVLVPVQELVKLHDDKEFTRFQKRSKLEFSTKLGMHSPL